MDVHSMKILKSAYRLEIEHMPLYRSSHNDCKGSNGVEKEKVGLQTDLIQICFLGQTDLIHIAVQGFDRPNRSPEL